MNLLYLKIKIAGLKFASFDAKKRRVSYNNNFKGE